MDILMNGLRVKHVLKSNKLPNLLISFGRIDTLLIVKETGKLFMSSVQFH